MFYGKKAVASKKNARALGTFLLLTTHLIKPPRKTADTQSKKSFPTLLYEHEKVNFCSAIFSAVTC